jgi:hypothetical protein
MIHEVNKTIDVNVYSELEIGFGGFGKNIQYAREGPDL